MLALLGNIIIVDALILDNLENKKTWFEFVAIDKATKKVVGSCSFYGGKGRMRHRGELGWGVHILTMLEEE